MSDVGRDICKRCKKFADDCDCHKSSGFACPKCGAPDVHHEGDLCPECAQALAEYRGGHVPGGLE